MRSLREGLSSVLVAAWRRTPRGWQWPILWAANAKFNVGLAAVVVNGDGEILVLRHAYRQYAGDWGLPTGWMRRGESFQQAIAREVLEETGLQVEVGELLAVESGYRLRVELVFRALARGARAGAARPSGEVHEARFMPADAAGAVLTGNHRRYVRLATRVGMVEEPAR
jgi:8-oxo-dGTP diphosphatase